MKYFRNPAFSAGTAGLTLVFLSMFGVMFLFTQYFQLILGYSALSAAVRFLPIAPIMMIVAPLRRGSAPASARTARSPPG